MGIDGLHNVFENQDEIEHDRKHPRRKKDKVVRLRDLEDLDVATRDAHNRSLSRQAVDEIIRAARVLIDHARDTP